MRADARRAAGHGPARRGRPRPRDLPGHLLLRVRRPANAEVLVATSASRWSRTPRRDRATSGGRSSVPRTTWAKSSGDREEERERPSSRARRTGPSAAHHGDCDGAREARRLDGRPVSPRGLRIVSCPVGSSSPPTRSRRGGRSRSRRGPQPAPRDRVPGARPASDTTTSRRRERGRLLGSGRVSPSPPQRTDDGGLDEIGLDDPHQARGAVINALPRRRRGPRRPRGHTRAGLAAHRDHHAMPTRPPSRSTGR